MNTKDQPAEKNNTLDTKLFEIELDIGDLEERLRKTYPFFADKLLLIMAKVQDLQEENSL